MTHRYISTDNGLECFACGIVLDYMSPDDPESPYPTASDADRDRLEDAARSLAFGLCHPGNDARAHHYILEGVPLTVDGTLTVQGAAYLLEGAPAYKLVCAYDTTTIDALTDPTTVDPVCLGA